METKNGLPIIYAASGAEWRTWLSRHSKTVKALLLVMQRKNSPTPGVGYAEAIEEGLCYGFIDSKAIRRDDNSFYLTFTERNPKSNWGKVAKERAVKMVKAGKMTQQGQAFIDLAKETGTWDIYAEVYKGNIPSDLQTALSRNKAAARHFEAFPPSARRSILEWILKAKRPETRARRIEEAVTLAAQNIRAAQPQRVTGKQGSPG